jgi:hypothetical protein
MLCWLIFFDHCPKWWCLKFRYSRPGPEDPTIDTAEPRNHMRPLVINGKLDLDSIVSWRLDSVLSWFGDLAWTWYNLTTIHCMVECYGMRPKSRNWVYEHPRNHSVHRTFIFFNIYVGARVLTHALTTKICCLSHIMLILHHTAPILRLETMIRHQAGMWKYIQYIVVFCPDWGTLRMYNHIQTLLSCGRIPIALEWFEVFSSFAMPKWYRKHLQCPREAPC